MIKQQIPDTFSVPVKIQIRKPNLNSRYKNFRQIHFTVGDEEQFEYTKRKDSLHIQNSFDSDNRSIVNIDIWKNFSLETQYTSSTFKYMFYKFKKGIFIQIRSGTLNFVPFSNAYFVNEWSDRIGSFELLSNEEENILPKRKWYTNNGLMRYENPCNETDTGFSHLKHMFESLLKEYPKIPDMDLFVNRRDFPILTKDKTEPYENIWDSEEQPLVSYNFEKYTPILSSSSGDRFADIPIPTMDDWIRVMKTENVFFASTKRTLDIYDDSFETPWSRKKSIAVFRGTATGIGIDSQSNVRIHLCEKFGENVLFNVGLTSNVTRFRKCKGSNIIQKADISKCTLKNHMSIEEQSKYKYIIHVEGHTQAYRLSIELATRSVILFVKSKYKIWFEDFLTPWVHYIPVSNDLSDLEEKVKWCIDNDIKCKEITENARKFYDEFLCKNGILKYIHDVLWNLWHKTTRNFINTSFELSVRYIEGSYLKNIKETYPFTRQYVHDMHDRTFENLKRLNVNNNFRSHTIFRNHSTSVTLCESNNNKWIRKNSHCKDSRHELFVGLFGANKILQHIPNFCYTIPQKYNPKSRDIFLEYIDGETFFEYIKSNKFDFNEWIFIVTQLILAIGVSQRVCLFTHNDLCPWNIILKKIPFVKQYDYLLDLDNIFRVNTSLIPIIIDYDKAHIMHEMQSFSLYRNYNSFQDCICLLISCMYNIIKYQKLKEDDKNKLLYIARESFIDPIYCPSEEIMNFSDLCNFLEESHKYAHITFSQKGKLNDRKPANLMSFFQNMCGNSVQKIKRYKYSNLGTVSSDSIEKTSSLHPILYRYLLQKGMKESENIRFDTQWNAENFEFIYPILGRETTVEIIPVHYLDHMNIFIELCSYEGEYELKESERDIVLKKIADFLSSVDYLGLYGLRRTNLKLQKNIV